MTTSIPEHRVCFNLRYTAPRSLTRAHEVIAEVSEAYYSSREKPYVRNYDDLLHQVATMLWQDSHDARPIQLLYAYFVSAGSDTMEPTLQDLGNYLMDRYGLPFEHVEQVLNMVARRLVALGRVRAMQRGDHLKHIRHGGDIDAGRMMRGEW